MDTSALPSIDFYGVSCHEAGHRIIAGVREQSGIALGPYGLEVLRYDLVRAVLRDSRFGMPAGIGLAMQGIASGPLWERVCNSIVGLDGPGHQRLRRLVVRAFTPKSADRMRAACRDVIDGLVDRHVDDGRCDVVTDLARHYPVPIICALLGVDRQDWELFAPWVRGISRAFSPYAAANEESIVGAWDQLDDYVDELIARRRRAPSDDLISELIEAEQAGLAHDELLNLVATLMVAGTDTTRNQLAAAVQVLCEHPKLWALLGERPDLAPRVVEEVIRHSPVSFSAVRVALDDVELDGVCIPEGTVIVVNTASANRDPLAYADPDRLDVTRSGPPPMLTFGGGAHHCLGAHLARVELAEALAVMARRMPNARLAGAVPWRPLIGITGPRTVPIEY
jgi:cytochrome P450